MTTRIRSQLTRKYAEFGYGTTPLMYIEEGTKSVSMTTNDNNNNNINENDNINHYTCCECNEYSLRFHHRGPDFVIHMGSSSSSSTTITTNNVDHENRNDDDENNEGGSSSTGSNNCFGKIVRGRETIK